MRCTPCRTRSPLDTTAEQALATASESQPVAVIVGAGYVALEMAEALTARGFRVVVLEQLPRVSLRTLDSALAARVEQHLRELGVEVWCGTAVPEIHRTTHHTGADAQDG